MMQKSAVWMWMACGLAACGGAGEAGPAGAAGAAALIAIEDAGSACDNGGIVVLTGVDDDGDGTLSESEVDASEAVCNGEAGTDGDDGEPGQPGADGDDALQALVNAVDEPSGATCANGGTRIDAGVDTDGDGELDASEVTSTTYLCNGATEVAIRVETEAPGANCVNGGTMIATGADDNANNVLDAGEEDEVFYVCEGAPGQASVIRVTGEPPGPNCAEGGVQIDAGLDINGDGLLQNAEVTSTAYLCGVPIPTTDTAGTPTTPSSDTALAIASYAGSATVVPGVSWSGVEALRVVGLPTSTVLCEWTWSATGVPTTVPRPCRDADGNACDFAFDVTLANDGQETDGDCVALFGSTLGVAGGGPYPYGYISDYQYGGNGYGPWMMYFFAAYNAWYIVSPYAYHDPVSNQFDYDWPVGYVAYVP